ncbi:MAG: hypothetical protein HQ526_04310, partial [Actinobacteria bacterium]|nr:hypothetical protein [Actinomycetota bacterium]
PYETVAGYLMAALGRLPQVGDVIAAPGADLEVMELDGRRASRVRVRPVLPAVPASATAGDDEKAEQGTMPE